MDLTELATITALIGGSIAGVTVAVVGGLRKLKDRRSDRPPPQIEPADKTIVRVDDSDGEETTGQFIIALQKAKPDVLETFIHELRKSNAKEPATRQDVANEVAPVRADMKRHNEAYSAAIMGLRNDVGELQDDVGGLKVDVGKLKESVAEIRGTGCGLPFGPNGGSKV